MLKFVYSLFLGLLLVIFVGFGVATFYPSPKAPEYPKALERPLGLNEEYTAEQKAAEADYQKGWEAYTEKSKDYNRIASILALGAAVVFLVVGLVLESRIGLLADGLLLGGTFTLIYSIARSFASDDPRYSFIMVSVGLVITIVLGYLKFIRPQTIKK